MQKNDNYNLHWSLGIYLNVLSTLFLKCKLSIHRHIWLQQSISKKRHIFTRADLLNLVEKWLQTIFYLFILFYFIYLFFLQRIDRELCHIIHDNNLKLKLWML